MTKPPDKNPLPDDPRAALSKLLDAGLTTLEEVYQATGYSATAISQWRRGKYEGRDDLVEKQVRRFLNTKKDVSLMRASGLDRHASLGVTEQVSLVAAHAHANRGLGVVYGAAGAGKTWALQRYSAQHANAWYTSMSPATTTPAAVLGRIAGALDMPASRATAAGLERLVIGHLSGGQKLLMVDESHHLGQPLLDVIRCVYDAAGCGLVLAGNEPLWTRLASGDRAAQLVSRVDIARRLQKPTQADILKLAEILLEAAPQGAGRAAVLKAGKGTGGLRAVRKLIAQAQLLARAEDRDQATGRDLADAAALLTS